MPGGEATPALSLQVIRLPPLTPPPHTPARGGEGTSFPRLGSLEFSGCRRPGGEGLTPLGKGAAIPTQGNMPPRGPDGTRH